MNFCDIPLEARSGGGGKKKSISKKQMLSKKDIQAVMYRESKDLSFSVNCAGVRVLQACTPT